MLTQRCQLKPLVAVWIGAFLLVLITASCGCAASHQGLAFFRVTEDKWRYAAKPDRYERIVAAQTGGYGEVYAEKAVALSIPASEIEAVHAETAQPDPAAREVEQDLSHRGRQVEEEHEEYALTIRLSEKGAQVLKQLVASDRRMLFDVKLNGQRVTVGRFMTPFEREISIFIGRETLSRLREAFPLLQQQK